MKSNRPSFQNLNLNYITNRVDLNNHNDLFRHRNRLFQHPTLFNMDLPTSSSPIMPDFTVPETTFTTVDATSTTEAPVWAPLTPPLDPTLKSIVIAGTSMSRLDDNHIVMEDQTFTANRSPLTLAEGNQWIPESLSLGSNMATLGLGFTTDTYPPRVLTTANAATLAHMPGFQNATTPMSSTTTPNLVELIHFSIMVTSVSAEKSWTIRGTPCPTLGRESATARATAASTIQSNTTPSQVPLYSTRPSSHSAAIFIANQP